MSEGVDKRGQMPDNVIGLPTTLDGNFFRYWVEFLKPLHNLTEREIDVVVAFLKKRYELSKEISNAQILDKFLTSEETKREIREECNITLAHFQVIMGKLKKSGIFKEGKLNQRFIPNVKEEKGNFQLLLFFQFK